MGEAAKVDEQTMFSMGSTTKAFTSAVLAMLVDEGKLSWDSKVVDLLPGFRMYDAYTSSEMTVRDLLVHRSGLGLGAGDLLFVPETTLTRAQIVEKLRYIKPATSFRSGYAYDNLLYVVAGQLIEEVCKDSWENVVRQAHPRAAADGAHDRRRRRRLPVRTKVGRTRASRPNFAVPGRWCRCRVR